MTKNVLKAAKKRKIYLPEDVIHNAIAEEWKDKIASVWSVEDVKTQAWEKYNINISDKDAMEVLRDILHYLDCTIGITWDVIDYWIDEYKLNEKYEKEDKPWWDIGLKELRGSRHCRSCGVQMGVGIAHASYCSATPGSEVRDSYIHATL